MIYSLTARRPDDYPPGGFRTGVLRFAAYLEGVFPEIRHITPSTLPALTPDDVVIADNHHSVHVPDSVPTIVVHHGCAITHFERDPQWRTPDTERMCKMQREMFCRPNRTYVAPSDWVRGEFARHVGLPADYARVIVNWVPAITPETDEERSAAVEKAQFAHLPVVLGDPRDWNKGSATWAQIESTRWDARFVRCNFRTEAGRRAAYLSADAYLCLSLSEGGSYSFADAKAAGLALVSTDVGNAREFGAEIIHDRDDLEGIGLAIARALGSQQRQPPTPWAKWAAAWQRAVEDACSVRGAVL